MPVCTNEECKKEITKLVQGQLDNIEFDVVLSKDGFIIQEGEDKVVGGYDDDYPTFNCPECGETIAESISEAEEFLKGGKKDDKTNG